MEIICDMTSARFRASNFERVVRTISGDLPDIFIAKTNHRPKCTDRVIFLHTLMKPSRFERFQQISASAMKFFLDSFCTSERTELSMYADSHRVVRSTSENTEGIGSDSCEGDEIEFKSIDVDVHVESPSTTKGQRI